MSRSPPRCWLRDLDGLLRCRPHRGRLRRHVWPRRRSRWCRRPRPRSLLGSCCATSTVFFVAACIEAGFVGARGFVVAVAGAVVVLALAVRLGTLGAHAAVFFGAACVEAGVVGTGCAVRRRTCWPRSPSRHPRRARGSLLRCLLHQAGVIGELAGLLAGFGAVRGEVGALRLLAPAAAGHPFR